MTLYDRIRQLRIDNKMSQTDLAQKMGYKDGSMITKIESGKVDISQKKVIAFAKALDTTPAYLMGWVSDEEYQERWKDYEESQRPPDVPHTQEARILAKGIDKLPKEQREQALSVIRAMFAKYADYFEKGIDDHDET